MPGNVEPTEASRFRVIAEVSRKQRTVLQHVFDNQRKCEAALKLIDLRDAADPTIRARYPREIELVRCLGEPGILPVLEYGELDGWFYILTPWLSGGSLGQKLRTDGPLTLSQVDSVLQPITAALDAAHEMGILHLDIHPENILFNEDGAAFLTDFGMLRFAEAWVEDRAGWIIGPPAAMPPEMALAGAEPDARADIYMLGALTFEMLAGSPPYIAATPQGSVLQNMTAPLPRLGERRLDAASQSDWEGLDAVIHCAMQKDPDLRFTTSGEMLTALVAAEGLAAPAEKNTATIFTLSGRQPTRALPGGGFQTGVIGVGWADQPPAFPPPPPPDLQAPAKLPHRRNRLAPLTAALLILAILLTGMLALTRIPPAQFVVWGKSVGLPIRHLPWWPTALPTSSVASRFTAVSITGWPATFTPRPTETLESAAPAGAATATETPPKPTAWPTPTSPPTPTIPPPTDPTTYTIAYNDTLFTIASQYYVDLADLASVNNFRCDSQLPVSREIVIPPSYAYSPPANTYALTTRNYKSLNLIHIFDCLKGIESVDVSPDGLMLAAASGNYIYIYEVGSWKPLMRLKGHQSVVDNVRFSPDNRILASSSEDRTIRLWDLSNGAEIAKMGGHSSTITALVFAPGGQQLVSASRDLTVRFWQVDGTFLRQIRGYPAFSAAFSPDGQTLAVGYADRITQYRVDDLQEIASYPSSAVVRSVAWSPSGLLLATSNEVWSVSYGRRIHHWAYNPTDRVVFSTDGRMLAVGRRFFDVSSGLELNVLKMPVEEASRMKEVYDTIALSPDGSLFFWGAPDGLFVYGFPTLPIPDTVNGTLYTVKEGDTFFSIANASGRTLDSLINANELTCSHVIFPSQELVIPPQASQPFPSRASAPVMTLQNITKLNNSGVTLANRCLIQPYEVTYSPDGRYLYSGTAIWDLTTGAIVMQVSDPSTNPEDTFFLDVSYPLAAFAPNAPQAAVRSGREVELWDLTTGLRQMELTGHTDLVTSVAYAPDGSQLASSANIRDKDILLWNVADGTQTGTLSGWSAFDLIYTADGQRLIAGSADTMRFWDLSSGRMLKGMTGVGAYRFSPTRGFLAYVACLEPGSYRCNNEVISLYNINTDSAFLSLVPVSNLVSSLTFSPEGLYVGAASGNGATVWKTNDGSQRIRLGDEKILSAMTRLYFVPAANDTAISLVATMTEDGTLHFWNIADGSVVHSLYLPNDRLSFTPDGRWMLVLRNDTITIYQVSP